MEENKYKAALERGRKMRDAAKALGFEADVINLEVLFPELKEDERIRDEISAYLSSQRKASDFGGDIVTFDKWISWLGRQGEPTECWYTKKVGELIERTIAAGVKDIEGKLGAMLCNNLSVGKKLEEEKVRKHIMKRQEELEERIEQIVEEEFSDLSYELIAESLDFLTSAYQHRSYLWKAEKKRKHENH